jgi:predicted RNA-binding Zn-ribbon protein involved in translation (DUF1610 family)
MTTKNSLQCPDCQVDLKLVLLTDLVDEVKARGAGLTSPAINAVFDHFNFWVCPKCGRTTLYAGQRAQAIAAGTESDESKGILGLG